MKLNKLYIALIGLLLISTSITSCKKTCVINKEDTNSGVIIDEFNGKQVVLFGPTEIGQPPFRVSFDGGYTLGPVDYNTYNVLSYPLYASCEASFDREVIINSTAQTVTYNIEMTRCAECEEVYIVRNHVLVPAFPQSYTVLYNVVITDVN